MERLSVAAVVLLTFIAVANSDDLPCIAKDVGIEGRSIVCVCNATYCDTITREAPVRGTFVAYTSTEAGKRFEKSHGHIQTDSVIDEIEESEESSEETGGVVTVSPCWFETCEDSDENSEESAEEEDLPDSSYEDEEISDDADPTILNRVSLRVYSLVRHQYIEGFGGSVTDAASINWRKMSDDAQTQFINTYFGPKGIEYNLMRIPIGGSDFSTHPYAYNEYPWHDAALSNFSVTDEDLFFKLPMIKRSERVATDAIKITASTWSPPVWMKSNERIAGFSQLRPDYYQSYADYHIRFMEAYERAEVNIWAITTTNEPIKGIVPIVASNSLGWTPSQMGRWVANNLGPTLRNSRFNQTLILAVDDQRYVVPTWLRGMEREDPKSIEFIDGIAVQYYGNIIPGGILTRLHNRYPGKILLSTEACEGWQPWEQPVELGSWNRARKYTTSIIEDLNNFVVGWIDWNLCLDPEGGPNWTQNYVDAPILVYGDRDEFIKQPTYYAMGHFSKFVPRGSRRIRVSRRSLVSVENVAFIKPDGNYVMVLQNRRSRELTITVRFTSRTFIEFKMEPRSIKTIEINHD